MIFFCHLLDSCWRHHHHYTRHQTHNLTNHSIQENWLEITGLNLQATESWKFIPDGQIIPVWRPTTISTTPTMCECHSQSAPKQLNKCRIGVWISSPHPATILYLLSQCDFQQSAFSICFSNAEDGISLLSTNPEIPSCAELSNSFDPCRHGPSGSWRTCWRMLRSSCRSPPCSCSSACSPPWWGSSCSSPWSCSPSPS